MHNSTSRFPLSSGNRSGDNPLRYAVRMPIDRDGSVDSLDDAVHALRQCDPAELRRARRHHRRALSALERGSYEALGDDTRAQLVNRLRTDLEALDRALHGDPSRSAPSDDASSQQGRSVWSMFSV
jgi:hypothetical protein